MRLTSIRVAVPGGTTTIPATMPRAALLVAAIHAAASFRRERLAASRRVLP
jgi:hypothetical protein